jgi:hypothetical protein
MAYLAASEFATANPVLLDSKTEEFGAGWVFYYQSARYLHTKEVGDMLLGNAPLFVARSDAKPKHISPHRSTAESIEAFVSCGDPNASANAQVQLDGWEEGALAVSAVQAIRGHSSLGLGAAKHAVDQCLVGAVVRVNTPSVPAARELALELQRFHFYAKVTYGG